MYRKSFIIKKENLFKWIENEQVSKVEIANCYNKSLRDKSLCKIYVYFKINYNDFYTIIGSCKTNIDKVNSYDGQFLKGIKSIKGEGFISEKLLKKLIDIEKRNDINLSISGEIKNMNKIRVKE